MSDDPVEGLRGEILELSAAGSGADPERARGAVERLLALLEEGRIRAAEKGPGGWKAVAWVKSGILLAFRFGRNRAYDGGPGLFFDKDTLPLHPTRGLERNIRIVPGGTSIRRGVYLGEDVIFMPPAFVNVGAWIGRGTMVDSHALVGSCAQVGERVHLSAGAQIGGVLEPVGSRPVVVEDEVMVGGNCGIFEGVLVERRAVLAPGVALTASTPLIDLVRRETHRSEAGDPLTVPEGAVVVPGSRPARGEFAAGAGIHLYAPVIVKYRDEDTDAATALEEALR